jgi:hypothetical protein
MTSLRERKVTNAGERLRLAREERGWNVDPFRAVGFPPLDALPIPTRYRTVAASHDVYRATPGGSRMSQPAGSFKCSSFCTEDRWTLEVWECLAGCYRQGMGRSNSDVLAPAQAGSTPLAFINHVRWNMSLPRSISGHRRSFRGFVIANLRDNNIGSRPYLCRHRNSGG